MKLPTLSRRALALALLGLVVLAATGVHAAKKGSKKKVAADTTITHKVGTKRVQHSWRGALAWCAASLSVAETVLSTRAKDVNGAHMVRIVVSNVTSVAGHLIGLAC